MEAGHLKRQRDIIFLALKAILIVFIQNKLIEMFLSHKYQQIFCFRGNNCFQYHFVPLYLNGIPFCSNEIPMDKPDNPHAFVCPSIKQLGNIQSVPEKMEGCHLRVVKCVDIHKQANYYNCCVRLSVYYVS